MGTRRRLAPEDRMAEILEVATEQFARLPYDEVLMDEVAAGAGVSRALLYRYFPGKRDLFAGVYQAAADQLLEIATVEPDQPLEPQVVSGLDAHIDYFLANRSAVLTANRTLAGDPVIQAIIGAELAVLRDRVLATQPVDAAARAAMSTVLMSWLTFVRVLCVDWLAEPAFDRVVLRDVCVSALRGALHPLVDGSGPAQS